MSLHIHDISMSFWANGKKLQILHKLNAEIPGGTVASLVGKSGCGKSTLLAIAAGLLRADSGSVLVAGQDVRALPPRKRPAVVGLVFQRFHVFPYLDVVGNVLVAGVADGRTADRKRATELLERFGLGHRLAHHPGQLSTGERQRCAIARALYLNPPVLLADEPTGSLDPESAASVLQALRDAAAQGTAVFIASHDPHLAASAQLQFRMLDGALQTIEKTQHAQPVIA